MPLLLANAPEMRYALLADDMTGAADAGVEFARLGWRTRTLRRDWQPADLLGVEVAVVDTASRACTAPAAYTLVHEAATRLREAGCGVIYKKIDSTLRGPLGAELDALLDACDLSLAVVCPAFPAAGRTLVNGALHVGGVPVSHTAARSDPISPVAESHLPTLLAAQSRRPVHHLSRPEGDYGATALAATLQSLRSEGGLAIVDALDDLDLARIVEAARLPASCSPSGLPILLVGSAGLAGPLAASLAADRRRQVLVLCGSLHPVTRTQVHVLQEQQRRTANSDDAAIMATPADAAPGSSSQEPVRVLAQAAVAWLASHTAAGLIVTGGDTLGALLGALEAGGIDLQRALAPGIPLGQIAGGPWAGLPVVSKAGGFGEPGTLLEIVRQLL